MNNACVTYLSFIEQPYLDIGNFLWTYLYKYYNTIINIT